MKQETQGNDQALSLADAASMLRLGEDALRELIVSGRIPALSLNRKHVVLLREDVIQFIRTHAHIQQEQRRVNWGEARGRVLDQLPPATPRKRGRPRYRLPTV